MKRVVVTGLGAVTSIGHSVPAFWRALQQNASGITLADAKIFALQQPSSQQKTTPYVALVKDFPFGKYKAPHADNRMNSFLLCAAEEAIKHSGGEVKGERVGVSLGIMASEITSLNKIIKQSSGSKFSSINRLSMLQILANIPASVLAVRYGIKGPCNTVATACASSSSAILDAYRRIQTGEADLMLAGGSQDVANPIVLHSSLRLGAMSSKKYNSPDESSRPFDQKRSGFILGEGAGIIVLQSEESARSRGANIIARIIGGATNCDGFHLTRPADEGEGVYRSMKTALQQAKVKPEQVNLFNCHATSTPAGDQLELFAIWKLLGKQKRDSSALSVKGHIGHAFGAAGVIQCIAGLKMAQTSTVVGTKNLTQTKEQMQQLLEREGTREKKVKYWVKNSLGFGGVNVSLVFEKP